MPIYKCQEVTVEQGSMRIFPGLRVPGDMADQLKAVVRSVQKAHELFQEYSPKFPLLQETQDAALELPGTWRAAAQSRAVLADSVCGTQALRESDGPCWKASNSVWNVSFLRDFTWT